MFHEKVATSAQRQRRDSRVRTQKAFVVRVIRDTIRAGSVVIDEAEVECLGGMLLDGLACPVSVTETGDDV